MHVTPPEDRPSDVETPDGFKNALQHASRDAGFTHQVDLEKKTGLAHSTISAAFSPTQPLPSAKSVHAIVTAFQGPTAEWERRRRAAANSAQPVPDNTTSMTAERDSTPAGNRAPALPTSGTIDPVPLNEHLATPLRSDSGDGAPKGPTEVSDHSIVDSGKGPPTFATATSQPEGSAPGHADSEPVAKPTTGGSGPEGDDDQPANATGRPPVSAIRRSRRPLVAAVLVLAAIAGGAVWWFATRPDVPSERTIVVQNKVAFGAAALREDDSPSYLAARPIVRCANVLGCKLQGTDLSSGDTVDATCQLQGALLTNADVASPGVRDNPNVAASTLWYGVRWSDGRRGYISEVYVAAQYRGGLQLPPC